MEFEKDVQELKSLLEDFFSLRTDTVRDALDLICRRMEAGGKILIFGNGGSASQAQHFAAEIVNRYLKERKPLPAIALTTDTSILTAVSNDVSFERIFALQIAALGKKEDIALGLTTSGASLNVIQGLAEAGRKGMLTVALTGSDGSRLRTLTECVIEVPSKMTPRIQEVHLFLLHLMAGEIEQRLG